MIDATPGPKDHRNQTIAKIARAFLHGERVQLGRYICTGEQVPGCKVQLSFVNEDTNKRYEKTIANLGLNDAAAQAYRWWTVDAWNI